MSSRRGFRGISCSPRIPLPAPSDRSGHCFAASVIAKEQRAAVNCQRRRQYEECMTKIMPVIMCGGSGTRMWPESRESLPKQFIPLIGQRSTFQAIVSVVSDPAVFDPAVVITNFDYRFRVAEQLREIGAEAVILLEPDGRVGRDRNLRRHA